MLSNAEIALGKAYYSRVCVGLEIPYIFRLKEKWYFRSVLILSR